MGPRFRTLAAIALTCLVWAAAPTARRDHLVPETTDSTDEYEANVRLVLREAFAPGVALRAVVQPSFRPEYAVGLRRMRGRWEIFSLVPARQVWHYSLIAMMQDGSIQAVGSNGGDVIARHIARLKAGLPKRPADLPVARCSVQVDSAMAASLAGAWRAMLENVHADEEPAIGLDGVSYHFAMASRGGNWLAGEAWSGEPETNTRTGRLAATADAMRDFCGTRDPADARRILVLARKVSRG